MRSLLPSNCTTAAFRATACRLQVQRDTWLVNSARTLLHSRRVNEQLSNRINHDCAWPRPLQELARKRSRKGRAVEKEEKAKKPDTCDVTGLTRRWRRKRRWMFFLAVSSKTFPCWTVRGSSEELTWFNNRSRCFEIFYFYFKLFSKHFQWKTQAREEVESYFSLTFGLLGFIDSQNILFIQADGWISLTGCHRYSTCSVR